MLRAKLLYAVVLISLAVFYVLYIDSLPLLMLLCVLILPVFLKAGLIWMHFTSECRLTCGAASCSEGDSIPVTVTLESHCPLFFPRAEAEIQVKHAFGKKSEILHLKFPVQAKNNTRLTFYLHAEYCGLVELQLVRLRVYDMFRIFSTRVRSEQNSAELLVLPRPMFMPLQASAPPVDQPESEHFADRPGDDPSEIFGIREYAPGDPVSRMHWKLSSRSDTLLFKEFSLPIEKNTLLYIEYVPSKTLADARTLLTLCYSMAYRIIDDALLCEMAWNDGSQIVCCQPDSEESLEEAFRKLYAALFRMKADPDAVRETFGGRAYSSVTVLSNDPRAEILSPIEQLVTANQRNFLLVTEKETSLQSDLTEIHIIRPDDVIPDRIIV